MYAVTNGHTFDHSYKVITAMVNTTRDAVIPLLMPKFRTPYSKNVLKTFIIKTKIVVKPDPETIHAASFRGK